MMTKSDLKRDLKQSVGGASMMTMTDLQRYLGKGKTFTRDFVNGMDYFGGDRKGKMYHVDDVAERLLEIRR